MTSIPAGKHRKRLKSKVLQSCLSAFLTVFCLGLWVPAHAEEPDAPTIGAHGLRLPASFTGTLPCADCEGLRHHLDLWPDQTFHLRREWLGEPGDNLLDEIGRWYAAPEINAIVLSVADGEEIAWEVKAADRLRLLDIEGNPIESTLPYDLTGDGTLAQTDLSLRLAGMFVYYADAALFRECISGRGFPVSEDAGYLSLQRAYVATRVEPQEPVLVTLDATLAERPVMEGPPRHSLVVEKTIAAWPGETCARELAQPPLTNTYWRIRSLLDKPVEGSPDGREPYLLLLDREEPRFAATVGCNMKIGGYAQDEASLRFQAGPSTLMACPPTLQDSEMRLDQVLARTAAYRRGGYAMTLHGDDGRELAVLEAVYVR